MWQFLSTRLSCSDDNDYGIVTPVVSESLYCGDAAGRPQRGKRKMAVKKDFNSTDLKFASNVSLDFHTPETMFMGQSEKLSLPSISLGFEPKKHWADHCFVPPNITGAITNNPKVDRLFFDDG